MEAQVKRLTSHQYEKLADWAERIGLGALGTLVAQQIIAGKPIISWTILLGFITAIFVYSLAYQWLKEVK